MSRKLQFAIFGFVFLAAASPAAASVIWEDTFNRSDSDVVGNGWVEMQRDNNDVKVKSSSLWLRDKSPDASATQNGIDLSGYENIAVEFSWSTKKTEKDDFFYVDIRIADQTWLTIFQTDLGGAEDTFVNEAVALGVSANDVGDFDLRVRIDPTNSDETVRIDYIRITGSEIVLASTQAALTGPVANLSAPVSLGLFAVGLVGIGFAARRCQKA